MRYGARALMIMTTSVTQTYLLAPPGGRGVAGVVVQKLVPTESWGEVALVGIPHLLYYV